MYIEECKGLILSQSRIILYLKSRSGAESLSEIYPYPGLNQESCEEAYQELKRVAPHLLNREWSKERFSTLDPFHLSPSTRFGIESGLMQLLEPLPAFSLPFSALFQGSKEEIFRQAERAHQLGIYSAKVKIGALSQTDAATVLERLKAQFHLRVDLNQKWPDLEVVHFFSHYGKNDFDYIEDPLKEMRDYFPLPFALDFRPHLSHLIHLPMKALVLKPSLIGSMSEMERLKEKQPIVLSSCFDTAVGIYQIASLAKRMGLTLPQGLGPYFFSTLIPLEQEFKIEDGLIHIPEKISLKKSFYDALSHF